MKPFLDGIARIDAEASESLAMQAVSRTVAEACPNEDHHQLSPSTESTMEVCGRVDSSQLAEPDRR